MLSDFWLVLRWWGMLFLVGAAAFPLTKALFGTQKSCQFTSDREQKNTVLREDAGRAGRSPASPAGRLGAGWWDEGYLFSKAVGMAVVSWLVYALGTVKILPFSPLSVTLSLLVVFLFGILLNIPSAWFGAGKYSPVKARGRQIFPRQSSGQVYQKLNREDGSPIRSGMTGTLWWVIVLEELFFFAALLFWSWVKAHEPSIRGLEKFMDYGFMKSILNSQYFPPPDMWYAGFPINYYYFGHLVTAVLTKLSGIDLVYTFNLMLVTLFAITLCMSFSIGYQLAISNIKYQISNIQSKYQKEENQLTRIRRWGTPLLAGCLTAFLVTLAGNLQTIYAFTRGYSGDKVQPFWELLWGIGEIWEKLPEGLNRYWYANATRFIPFTIHEFPSYSFVVSDVHGHVLGIPFALLAIALLVQMAIGKNVSLITSHFSLIFYGFLVGVLLMTNALDGPIYFGLLVAMYFILRATSLRGVEKLVDVVLDFARTISLVVAIAAFVSFPFLLHFKSFVNGIAINCPPAFLANSRIGPFIFEGVEKCQRSPLWMVWLLWGFFLYCGGWLIAKNFKFQISNFKFTFQKSNLFEILNTKISRIDQLLLVFFLFSLALIVFPEFFYFKDIYPAHFRSNTMFKLGYQAFILFSIVSGYTIVSLLLRNRFRAGEENIKYPLDYARGGQIFPRQSSGQANFKYSYPKSNRFKTLFLIFLLPQLFLVSVYPIFAVRSYFGGLRGYEGLYGLSWLKNQYPDDWAAIKWLNSQLTTNHSQLPLALVEADGDSYTDYARFSAFTGIPTIVGWPVHEWLWRGSWDVVAPRREEARLVYEANNLEQTRQILKKYHVRYVIIGTLERQKYQRLAEWKLARLGNKAFQQGETSVYEVE